jgi:hypothetical protein
MSECDDAMSIGGSLGMPMSLLGVLESLPRMLVSRQVVLFSLLLGHTMSMGGAVV